MPPPLTGPASDRNSSPSPGTPGEGWGEGLKWKDEGGRMRDERPGPASLLFRTSFCLHPSSFAIQPLPLPEYRARGKTAIPFQRPCEFASRDWVSLDRIDQGPLNWSRTGAGGCRSAVRVV